MNHNEIEKVSKQISNCIYNGNLQATMELMELFDSISKKPLHTADDYIQMYDDNFYTYETWEELVKSEECCSDGLTEYELEVEFVEHRSIWQLPCGWYVQYV